MAARSTVGFVTVALLVLSGAPSSAVEPSGDVLSAAPACGRRPQPSSSEEVLALLADFHAARNAGDWAAVRCALDDDAVMISDGGIKNGPDEIIAEFQALATFFGGTVPTVYSRIPVSILGGNRYMVRELNFIDTTCVDILDGADTYVVKGGQIAALTTHGSFQFSC